MKKSNLDEMQEQKLLKIEHNGFWFAFFGLFAAIMIQLALGVHPFNLIGEAAVFFPACIYMVVHCIRSGIWDRRMEPTPKSIWLISLGASVFTALVSFACVASILGDFEVNWKFFLAVTVGSMVFTFLVCAGTLFLAARLYRKRREKLDQE